MTRSQLCFQLQSTILPDLGFPLKPGMRVLDFGCGKGELVAEYRNAGFEAYGCDFGVEHRLGSSDLREQAILRPIETAPYRLPFDDGMFDLVVSNQVMEHVQDYDQALHEMRRVLKPGGAGFHFFPARYRPLECHLHVPLGGWIQGYPWLWLWAALGIRNEYQTKGNAREVARFNREYLQTQTNYLTQGALAIYLRNHFETFRFSEDLFIKQSPRLRKIYPWCRIFPFLTRFYSAFHTRVVYFTKGEKKHG